jgi:hypothetical protein
MGPECLTLGVQSGILMLAEQNISPILEFLNPTWIERAYIRSFKLGNYVSAYVIRTQFCFLELLENL